jgi:hypothetical protein
VDNDTLRFIAVGLTAIWALGAVLALAGAVRAGALLNALLAAGIGAATVPTLLAMLFGPADYARRHGTGALGEWPLDAAVLGISVVALGASLAALRFGRVALALGWLANAPTVLLAAYLAFWFHIF